MAQDFSSQDRPRAGVISPPVPQLLSMSVPAPSTPSGAVFLSYAREDAAAARRIADALRGCGVDARFEALLNGRMNNAPRF
jgi:hypothetical protein